MHLPGLPIVPDPNPAPAEEYALGLNDTAAPAINNLLTLTFIFQAKIPGRSNAVYVASYFDSLDI